MAGKAIYVFLDEGGDLNFSPSGTRYFTMSSVTVARPFPIDSALHDLRFDLIEAGLDIDYFHAAEDTQSVRDRVFALIRSSLERFRIDSIVVEKRKVSPPLREDNRFYPEMLGCLLKRAVEKIDRAGSAGITVITDRIPVSRKRQAVEKAVKTTLARMLPEIRYRVLHHDSRSHFGLQIADYCNWAVFRAWERGDRRSLETIRPGVRSQLNVLGEDGKLWY